MKIPKNIYTYFTINPWYHGYTYKEKMKLLIFQLFISENIETTIFWSKSLSN